MLDLLVSVDDRFLLCPETTYIAHVFAEVEVRQLMLLHHVTQSEAAAAALTAVWLVRCADTRKCRVGTLQRFLLGLGKLQLQNAYVSVEHCDAAATVGQTAERGDVLTRTLYREVCHFFIQLSLDPWWREETVSRWLVSLTVDQIALTSHHCVVVRQIIM